MGLLKCPDCGHAVSDQASACPECGRPVRAPESLDRTEPAVTPIEKTSKRFKKQYLLAGILFLMGSVTCMGGIVNTKAGDTLHMSTVFGIWIIVMAVLWLCIVRIFAWWHHG